MNSQYGQDLFVDRYFKGKINGVFVDIGAFDGISLSNTFFFEKERSWTGICIEPQKKQYDLLVKNRSCACYNGCIYSRTGKVEFWNLDGPSAMLSGIGETLDDRHKNRMKKEIEMYGGQLIIEEVQTFSINDLLKENNIYFVDYCSVDTEGSELAVLQSIDFDSCDIKCFSVEGNYGFLGIDNFLLSKGYTTIFQLSGEEKIYIK